MGLFKRTEDKTRRWLKMRNTMDNIAGKKDVRSLIQLLNDDNEFIRGDAAYLLGILGDWEAFNPLNEALNKEQNAATVISIRAAIFSLQNP